MEQQTIAKKEGEQVQSPGTVTITMNDGALGKVEVSKKNVEVDVFYQRPGETEWVHHIHGGHYAMLSRSELQEHQVLYEEYMSFVLQPRKHWIEAALATAPDQEKREACQARLRVIMTQLETYQEKHRLVIQILKERK